MESVNDVKEALSARSRTATLEELRNEGRKKVRLIKAEHVAAMIAEAVHAAIDQSGFIPQEEVDKLVERSRQEFRDILREREQEALEAREIREQYAARSTELRLVKQQLGEAHEALAMLQQELDTARSGAGGAAPSEMMLLMMNELASLKASVAQREAQPAGGDFAAALEKLSGTLNDRLESIGKKVGISSAVEGDAVDFTGMFRSDDKQLESNLDNVKIKQKAGAGIAANLAKLKKLKGGG